MRTAAPPRTPSPPTVERGGGGDDRHKARLRLAGLLALAVPFPATGLAGLAVYFLYGGVEEWADEHGISAAAMDDLAARLETEIERGEKR